MVTYYIYYKVFGGHASYDSRRIININRSIDSEKDIRFLESQIKLKERYGKDVNIISFNELKYGVDDIVHSLDEEWN